MAPRRAAGMPTSKAAAQAVGVGVETESQPEYATRNAAT